MNPLATAKRLIAKHGGNVTLRRYARTAGDANKPWRGPGTTLADQRTEKSAIITREQAIENNLPVALGSMQALVAVPADAADLRQYDELVDGTEIWRVVGCNSVKYRGVRVLYVIGLEH